MIELWPKNMVPLYDESIEENCIPSITEYVVENSKSCILVCPGGGYHRKASDHEGIQIAQWLNSIGISAFVLDYRVAPYRYPCGLLDAKRAIRYIRKNASKYGYDEDKIGIIGFSAGGHLACNTSNSYDEETKEFEIGDEIDKTSAKVNFAILCYPVISYSDFAHFGSFKNLCGDDDKLKFALSLENRVTKGTPPTFIWATADDGAVPSKNTIAYTNKLFEHGVSFESHIFRHGRHGLGLANKDYNDIPDVAIWSKLCENWLVANDYL